jgi:hypothetical protein
MQIFYGRFEVRFKLNGEAMYIKDGENERSYIGRGNRLETISFDKSYK